MISSKFDSDRNLGVHTIRGKVTLEELIAALKRIYAGHLSPYNLWDLLEVEAPDLQASDIRGLAQLIKTLRPREMAGRTALVAEQDVVFGLGRMLEVYAELVEHPAKLRVFRSRDDALAWLDEDL